MLQHDERCEALTDPNERLLCNIFGDRCCECADRAIAKARREGRIEGYMLNEESWAYALSLIRGVIAHPGTEDDAAEAVDAKWPEDAPKEDK